VAWCPRICGWLRRPRARRPCGSCIPPVGSRDVEHIGSAHTVAEVELLKAAARQWLAAGQGVLDLGLFR
jgi:hypothetical protein